jgi:hypothetical protein
MAKHNATALKFYIMQGNAWKLISEQTSGSLSRSRDQIDTTSKDHDGYGTFIGGLRSAEASFDILVDHEPEDGKINYLDLVGFADAEGSGVHKFRIGGDGRRVEFDAMITSIEKNMDMETATSATIALRVSGKPIESEIV